MILNDLETQKAGFSDFFAILGCDAYLSSRIAPELLEIDQYNLCNF